MNNPFKRNKEKSGPTIEYRAERIVKLQERLIDEEISENERQVIAAEIAYEGAKILDIVKTKALRTAKIALIVVVVVAALAIAVIYLNSGDEELTNDEESEEPPSENE